MDCFSYYFGQPNSSESSSVENNGEEKKKKKKKKKGNNGKRSSRVVKLSTDPQCVAARERRRRISDRFKVLQSLLVPGGGTRMDTASVLEEAIHYVKFLKNQIWLHQTMISFMDDDDPSLFMPPSTALPAQWILHSPENLVAREDVQSSPPFGLQHSRIQGEETRPFDGTMNY